MEFRGKHFHYVGTELLVKLRGDIQNIQQLEWAWALPIQDGHLLCVVRAMPASSIWALLALMIDVKIEFSSCRPGPFSLPHGNHGYHKYFLLYSQTVMPLLSPFFDSCGSFVLS